MSEKVDFPKLRERFDKLPPELSSILVYEV